MIRYLGVSAQAAVFRVRALVRGNAKDPDFRSGDAEHPQIIGPAEAASLAHDPDTDMTLRLPNRKNRSGGIREDRLTADRVITVPLSNDSERVSGNRELRTFAHFRSRQGRQVLFGTHIHP